MVSLLDLLAIHQCRRLGFEVKLSDAPTVTKSMRIAMSDLGLKKLLVVYPGSESYSLDHGIEALSIADLPTRLRS